MQTHIIYPTSVQNPINKIKPNLPVHQALKEVGIEQHKKSQSNMEQHQETTDHTAVNIPRTMNSLA